MERAESLIGVIITLEQSENNGHIPEDVKKVIAESELRKVTQVWRHPTGVEVTIIQKGEVIYNRSKTRKSKRQEPKEDK